MTEITTLKSAAKHPCRMAREPKTDEGVAFPQAAAKPVVKPRSKSGMVLELLARADGATLDQLVTATGWLPHTTRAALTGLKQKGHVLTSDKVDGGPRIYRVASNAILTVEGDVAAAAGSAA